MNMDKEEDNSEASIWKIFNGTGEDNFTEYLEEVNHSSKPYRDPLYVVVPITVVYAAIFLTGIIGNISTCVVIARNKHMHTATNYYLFSLAISDLLLLVSGLPPEVFFMWRKHSYVFGETFCVLQSFAAETSANATVLTITAFTIERYVAICHPFQSHTLSKLSRAVRFVVAIWISALGLAIPQAIQYGVVTVVGASNSGSTESYCTLKKVLIPNAFLISICVFFVVPMTVITVLYVLIGLKLRRSRLIAVKQPSFNRGEASRHRTATSQSHVIRMLVAVVVGFFICWAPFHAQRLVAMYGHLDEHPSKTVYIVYIFLTYISGVLYYLSTTINPLLYHIMSHKFRDAFKSTLVQICSGKKRRATGKRKLYVTIPRQNNGLMYNGQSVSFHNSKPSGLKKSSVKGNVHQATLALAREGNDCHHSMVASNSARSMVFFRDAESLQEGGDIKVIKIANTSKEKDELMPRSRGSSNSSQITLTTSYSKIEDEGNNNHYPNKRAEPAEKKIFSGKDNTNGESVKGKCMCWNCENKKKGLSSFTNRCLFKSKTQSATLETIAKQIRLLPNTTKNKILRDRDGKGGGSNTPEKKFKLTKMFSSYTISNSSLQDLDESEFTSSELADIMAQMKKEGEVQV